MSTSSTLLLPSLSPFELIMGLLSFFIYSKNTFLSWLWRSFCLFWAPIRLARSKLFFLFLNKSSLSLFANDVNLLSKAFCSLFLRLLILNTLLASIRRFRSWRKHLFLHSSMMRFFFTTKRKSSVMLSSYSMWKTSTSCKSSSSTSSSSPRFTSLARCLESRLYKTIAVLRVSL